MQQSRAQCFHCDTPDNVKPLITLQFKSSRLHICPQCLPALIHHPDRVAEALARSGTSHAAEEGA